MKKNKKAMYSYWTTDDNWKTPFCPRHPWKELIIKELISFFHSTLFVLNNSK